MLFICVDVWAASVNDQNQWIQADLLVVHRIESVTTQGRPTDYTQWVTSYYVSYSQDGTRWETISTLFVGNNDQSTKKTNLLPGNIMARYIRLLPNSWNLHIAMRFDVTGCAVSGTIPHKTLVTIMPFLLQSGKFLHIKLLALIAVHILKLDSLMYNERPIFGKT